MLRWCMRCECHPHSARARRVCTIWPESNVSVSVTLLSAVAHTAPVSVGSGPVAAAAALPLELAACEDRNDFGRRDDDALGRADDLRGSRSVGEPSRAVGVDRVVRAHSYSAFGRFVCVCACAHVFVRGCACTIAFVLWEVAAALTVRERSSEGGQGGRGRGRPGLHSMDRVGTCSAQAALSYAALEPQRIVRMRAPARLFCVLPHSSRRCIGPVPAQMWARSRRRCGRGPGADVGAVPAQMWASPGADSDVRESRRESQRR